jgi:transcription-repair coupling factor (superfamily II helicase)
VIRETFRRAVPTDPIRELLSHAPVRLAAPPLPGAARAGFAASLLELDLPAVVVVAATPGEAEAVQADLDFLLGSPNARYFPQRETLPYEDADPHVEIAGQRIDALAALLAGRSRLLVTTARALAERSPVPADSQGFSLELLRGGELSRASLIERLERLGFERVHTVQELGEFAVRGGIIDVFPFGPDRPLRIELWGDKIASLREFDLLSQRSANELEKIEILPVDLEREDPGGSTRRLALLELLPASTLLFELAPGETAEQIQRLWDETVQGREAAGTEALEPDRLVLPPEAAELRLNDLPRIGVGTDMSGSEANGTTGYEGDGLFEHLTLEPPPPIDRDMARLMEIVARARGEGERMLILCDNDGQLERLEEILAERAGVELAAYPTLAIGSLSGGFRLASGTASGSLLVLTDHEIFRRSHWLRRQSRRRGVATLESIASIRLGDYVVHLDHGIGRYLGLERVEVGGEAIETLKVEYANGEILRVPHYRLDLMERWTAVGGDEDARPPHVHKLGGKRWKALKRRTVEQIQRMAAELVELYAHRAIVDGHSFSGDTGWQREMESAFLYEETPDQLGAWEDVKRDMEEPHPMERLVCGDVGFGKTEIAMRAAFKAAQDGKQVGVLAPTTVLAEQHLHTFRERLASFPVRIEALSRFRSRTEQADVLRGLEGGQVDIVIGTHRLLSQDVRFRDLGLLVVDEEQRFGVRHKERLKELKRSIDVLTMTATPIPRTLQMSLGRLRDLSLIETPPRDRMPIITHVLPWHDGIIQDAMRRELDRGGQVFFVHNRVETIDVLAERVRRLVPDAEVAVAHGQMPEVDLEIAMRELMEGAVDVLVCTSIIENGLDVPSANTMIVHQSDRFGLAQLYQLRGRVGRSHHRAYCYLLVPYNVAPEAERRLRVLEHHTELGSGYRVALRDLQLRGAGNLLGTDQSGFAQAVGLDVYQRLLAQTVRRLRGDGAEQKTAQTQVALEGEAFLPDDYILDAEQKMHLYRRISRIEALEEVADLGAELRDRFGPLPDAAVRLLGSIRLKLLGRALSVEWIRVGERTGRIVFEESAVPRLAVLRDAFTDRQLHVEVRRPQPLSLVLSRGGAEPLMDTLIEALSLMASTGSRSMLIA